MIKSAIKKLSASLNRSANDLRKSSREELDRPPSRSVSEAAVSTGQIDLNPNHQVPLESIQDNPQSYYWDSNFGSLNSSGLEVLSPTPVTPADLPLIQSEVLGVKSMQPRFLEMSSTEATSIHLLIDNLLSKLQAFSALHPTVEPEVVSSELEKLSQLRDALLTLHPQLTSTPEELRVDSPVSRSERRVLFSSNDDLQEPELDFAQMKKYLLDEMMKKASEIEKKIAVAAKNCFIDSIPELIEPVLKIVRKEFDPKFIRIKSSISEVKVNVDRISEHTSKLDQHVSKLDRKLDDLNGTTSVLLQRQDFLQDDVRILNDQVNRLVNNLPLSQSEPRFLFDADGPLPRSSGFQPIVSSSVMHSGNAATLNTTTRLVGAAYSNAGPPATTPMMSSLSYSVSPSTQVVSSITYTSSGSRQSVHPTHHASRTFRATPLGKSSVPLTHGPMVPQPGFPATIAGANFAVPQAQPAHVAQNTSHDSVLSSGDHGFKLARLKAKIELCGNQILDIVLTDIASSTKAEVIELVSYESKQLAKLRLEFNSFEQKAEKLNCEDEELLDFIDTVNKKAMSWEKALGHLRKANYLHLSTEKSLLKRVELAMFTGSHSEDTVYQFLSTFNRLSQAVCSPEDQACLLFNTYLSPSIQREVEHSSMIFYPCKII